MESLQRAISLLVKSHPYCAAILMALVPLYQAQRALAQELPAPTLPDIDGTALKAGKPWIAPTYSAYTLYVDQSFLQNAPQAITSAAAEGFPAVKDECIRLGTFLETHSDACKELVEAGLRQDHAFIASWAQQHTQHASATSLVALHLAGAAAIRVAAAAHKEPLSGWDKGYCPVCGNAPHGTYLKTIEGKRFLQCSLCRHEWAFARTTCPSCGQQELEHLPLFFLEGNPSERGEGCSKCNHYLLGIDTRECTGDIPLELTLLCMAPLDELMQEKGFVPLLAPYPENTI